MNKTTAVEMYKVLSPIPVTKFSAETQTALMQNYMRLHSVAKAHDDAIRAAVEKLRSEGIEDEKDLNAKLGAVIVKLFDEEVDLELAKVDREKFLAEATKAGIEVTLGQIAIIEPMFKA